MIASFFWLFLDWFWTICLLVYICQKTIKGVKTRRAKFFIPIILYFGLWAACRVYAENKLSNMHADMPVFATTAAPREMPDTIVVEGEGYGPTSDDLKSMGFHYMITGGVTYANRMHYRFDLQSKDGDKNTLQDPIETLPKPRLMFTSRNALHFLPEESKLGRKFPRKSSGGPWELIYVDQDGKESLIAYYWEPFVAIPAFFPIPLLHMPLLVPFMAEWRNQGNSVNIDDLRKTQARFVKDSLAGRKFIP